jgi:hypothetical protein
MSQRTGPAPDPADRHGRLQIRDHGGTTMRRWMAALVVLGMAALTLGP